MEVILPLKESIAITTFIRFLSAAAGIRPTTVVFV
jgi:hypothetical protein